MYIWMHLVRLFLICFFNFSLLLYKRSSVYFKSAKLKFKSNCVCFFIPTIKIFLYVLTRSFVHFFFVYSSFSFTRNESFFFVRIVALSVHIRCVWRCFFVMMVDDECVFFLNIYILLVVAFYFIVSKQKRINCKSFFVGQNFDITF
jgi:hypothetical protein